MQVKLSAYPLLAPNATEYAADASSLVQIIKVMDQGNAKSQLVQAYADSLKTVWAVMCAFAGVALVSSAAIKGLDLNRALETDQGLRSRTKEDEERAAKDAK